MEPFRTGIGVDGVLLTVTEASDRGGDGGVASVRMVSGLEWGGVEVVGEESVVAEVDVSDTGERGRKESAESS